MEFNANTKNLICPVCYLKLHPSDVLTDVVEHYFGNGTCPLYGKEFDMKLMANWQPKGQPQEPLAWGIFGLFPDSGGWCLQAGKVYTSQAAANDAYLGEYENSSVYMVVPLYVNIRNFNEQYKQD